MVGTHLHKHAGSLDVETLTDEIGPFHSAAGSLPANSDGRNLQDRLGQPDRVLVGNRPNCRAMIGVNINSECQPVIGALNPEKTLDGLSLKRAVSIGQRGPQFCFRASERCYSEFHLFSSELIAPQLGGTVAP